MGTAGSGCAYGGEVSEGEDAEETRFAAGSVADDD